MELRFRHIRPDEVEQELTQKDQFNTDSVPLAATLIRESIQNSTDARAGSADEPAIIRISFKSPDPANAEFWQPVLGQLERHLSACEVDVSALDLRQPSFLTIEDFGTTGLVGSYETRDDQNFNDFWRRVGRSHKASNKGGSWGLGKLVFPVSSDIRTFFGLTVRHDDPGRSLLMGQAILAGHKIDGIDHAAHGFFALHDDDGFQRPVLEPSYVSEFSAAVGFDRAGEPGLSVAIPFPREGLTKEALIPIVIENYFFPIIAGSLVVEIEGEEISAQTFDRLARRYRSGALGDGHLVGFIRDIETARSQPPVMELPDNWAAKGLVESLSEDVVDGMRDAYDKHQLVGVRAPMRLRTKGNEVMAGHFDLYLRKPTDDVPASALKPLFIRGSITIPNEESNFRNRPAFAALVATEPNVSRFLRDAENPAHTNWNGNADKLNERWRNAGPRLREIRRSLAQLHQLFDEAVDRRDNDALKALLFLPDQTGPRPTPGSDSTKPPRDFPQLPSAPRLFDIARRSGGFTLRAGAALAAVTLPIQIDVQAAYDLPIGNPFKKHSPYDFNFRIGQEIKVNPTGASWQAPTANRLRLTIKQPNFAVEVTGFDDNRDLVIAASRVEDEAPV
jgi:hypothetical protein